MAASIGRVGGILGPLLVGSLVASGHSIGFIFALFCASIVIGVIVLAFLGKETRQTELT